MGKRNRQVKKTKVTTVGVENPHPAKKSYIHANEHANERKTSARWRPRWIGHPV